MLSAFVNIIYSNSSQKNDVISKHISSFTILQRTIFLLSIFSIFWIGFIIIYLSSRLIIRLIKRPSPSSNMKICQAFVISANQYGSFRPIHSLSRSDSLFSNINFALTNEKIHQISNYSTVNITINHHSTMLDHVQYQQSKTSLLEHYLKTYNPLEIDFTHPNDESITTSNVKVISSEEIRSETEIHQEDNCYSLNCTNKPRLNQIGRYTRLNEQENCSSTMSYSECSTKLTSTTLPVVMVTDCSNSQRLHTDILEMNEEE